MNKTILAVALICAFSACKKSDKDLPVVEEVPNVEISLSALNEPAYSSSPQGDATYNFLGYGYDITDKHSSSDAVRAQIIDIHDYVKRRLSPYNPLSTTTSGYAVSYFAKDAADLSSQLSNKYNVTSGFKLGKPTITSAFPETNALSDKYVYGYYTSVSVSKTFRIWADDGLSSLTSTFSQDVNRLSSEQLVAKYGTHVLELIYLGSRINIIYQSEVQKDAEKRQVVIQGFNYAIKNTFGLWTWNFDDLDVKALNSNKSIKLKYELIGGDPTKVKLLDFNGIKKVDLNDWNKSVSENNYKFLGFSENRGLVPLYDMIDNASKKAAVKAYIEKYILDNQTELR